MSVGHHGKRQTLAVVTPDAPLSPGHSDIAPSHKQSYVERMFYSPKILEPVISSMCACKFSQAIGSTYFAGRKAVSHIPNLAGVATPVALGLATASGVVTAYSRFPSIREKMRDDGSSKTELVTNDLDFSALAFYHGVTSCAYISSVCVALSAYLGGQVFLTGFTQSILSATLPISLMPTGVGVVIPIFFGGLTAISSWYSFYAFSIDKARAFGIEQGKRFSEWLEAPTFSMNREMIFTLFLCVPVILSSAVGGRFFVEHALRLLTANFGLEKQISSSVIITISMISMIPNVVTNISTKAHAVYKMINPDTHEIKLQEENAKIVAATGYTLEDIMLSVFSLLEIIGCGLGGWESGNSLCRKFFNVEPTAMKNLQYALWNVPIIILAACEASQQYAFTIRDMFNSRALLRMQAQQAEEKNKDMVTTVRICRSNSEYSQAELWSGLNGVTSRQPAGAPPGSPTKLSRRPSQEDLHANSFIQPLMRHTSTA